MKQLIALILLLATPFYGLAQFKEKSKTYQKFKGFFNFYYNDEDGKLYLEVKDLEKDFLYVNGLSSGVGSNDIGLDRGQLGGRRVVYFKKAGGKLLLIQPNLTYRAITDNVLEKKSVEQAFASSVLYGFKIEEKVGDTYIIDITDFLLEDAYGVANSLKSAKQGNYSLDKSKSALNLERTKAFPKNIEFDAFLTFKGEPAGGYIRSVTPTASLVSVGQHHSFIALPEYEFKKRAFDPRSGAYPFSYYDYATPVEDHLVKKYIPRHHLEKKNPTAAVSEAKEPIIYYLDNGTPEPVRSALLEGGTWWNQAFEAAGYKNAFQLKMLPVDADPMDIRYNVIQWVHRSTRGWSYGSSVIDPRTGEILKGHVSLGSLRIRQDFLIAQALMNKPFAEDDTNNKQMLEMAIARIRQLSAHEIGHTLGFAHNFAASTNNRASVMDYPHPQFILKNNTIDFATAYDEGIGEWDKIIVKYAYSDFPDDLDESERLNAILKEAQDLGLRFISDSDARPKGSAHYLAHLWDNGTNTSEELEKVLEIRKQGIKNFSVDNIRTGEPYSVLEDVFAPLYFFHRYQVEATTKIIGGLDYNFAVKGDGQITVLPVENQIQKQALKSLLKTISAEEISIPKDKLGLFPPRAIGYGRTRESFKSRQGVAFDALAAPETAADITLELLFNPDRASRLIQQKSIDSKRLGLAEGIETVINQTIKKDYKDSYLQEVQTSINYRVLAHLLNLASQSSSHPQVNAIAYDQLQKLSSYLQSNTDADAMEIKRRIKHFFEEPEAYALPASPQIPDGSPIGMSCYY